MINTVCMIGLLPFLLIHIVQLNYISMVVFINGIIYHSSYNTAANVYLRYYDIIVNLCFLVWVNIYTTWQPQTLILSALACACFAGNYALASVLEPSISDVVHILLVQFPLAVALFRYQSDPPCTQSFDNLRY